jgi:hypothetical protein
MSSMKESEVTDSQLAWSITSATGEIVSTTLPQVCRTFEDYATIDFAIGDNDPVYFAVVNAANNWGVNWATKFCVGMLTYYHMGTAVKAADLDGEEFWKYLRSVYASAPRGSARRHFRGPAGLLSLDKMQQFSPNPVDFFTKFPQTYLGVKSVCINQLWGFGPYFFLKIADYMDRCLDLPMHSYDGLESTLSKVPAQATQVLYPDLSVAHGFRAAVSRLQKLELMAPPHYDRLIGPAEVETILCDWLHAKHGTNWLGADLIVKRQALTGYGPRSQRMSEWLPKQIPRNTFKLELV